MLPADRTVRALNFRRAVAYFERSTPVRGGLDPGVEAHDSALDATVEGALLAVRLIGPSCGRCVPFPGPIRYVASKGRASSGSESSPTTPLRQRSRCGRSIGYAFVSHRRRNVGQHCPNEFLRAFRRDEPWALGTPVDPDLISGAGHVHLNDSAAFRV